MNLLPHTLGQLPQISVTDVIDILLVALIIYQFLALIRGTRAVPILVGVAGITLAFYGAHVYPLIAGRNAGFGGAEFDLFNTDRKLAALETAGGVSIGWTLAPGHLEVRVEDEGHGLAQTTNLFVPFFTTKPGGSGIGLVLTRQIAEAHGGALTLENRRDRHGCRATLRLPRYVARAAENSAGQAEAPARVQS